MQFLGFFCGRRDGVSSDKNRRSNTVASRISTDSAVGGCYVEPSRGKIIGGNDLGGSLKKDRALLLSDMSWSALPRARK